MTVLYELTTRGLPVLVAGVLGFVLASHVAGRQELGKARAAAQLALRAEVVELRAHLAYHWRRYELHETYPDAFLTYAARSRRLCDMVAHAWGMSPRRRESVRQCLVQLFGELDVRAAEELSMVSLGDRCHPANDSEVWSAVHAAEIGEVAELGLNMPGSLHEFADDSSSEDRYNQARSDLDALLRTAGGAERLAPVR
ncbi:hypothetical protein QCN29_02195 [Streptomyces sp. HNM0663]|uniref:Secreted protein n=1 Tax=Streptomyces chengmaiensis TaxID=3040919 RepID=A0ABT6HGZ2_9ACTN|nr:hypothetical protein [Streptomyces chengmaiensis]MDH2387616.1 hypothetical protein [Streptomyces chengmaiensis]